MTIPIDPPPVVVSLLGCAKIVAIFAGLVLLYVLIGLLA